MSDADASDGIPFREIIEDLNQVANRSFEHNSKRGQSNRKLIKALWNKGYRLPEFKRVHRVKAEEWLGKEKMETYLRPSTLYNATHFPEYLQQPRASHSQMSETARHNLEVIQNTRLEE
jgi:uncharacterized phage protein (TIGR02220 family)